jgi:hypothetical protein
MPGLKQIVGELQRAADRARAARFLLHALLAAATIAVALLLLGRFFPIEPQAFTIFALPISLLVTFAAWLVTRPSADLVVQVADLRLGLDQRLSTAWERRHQQSPLDQHLQADAVAHTARLPVKRAFPMRLDRREAGFLGLLSIGFVVLTLLPNPMESVIARHNADHAAQAAAANTLQSSRAALQASRAPDQAKVEQILEKAQRDIAAAPDPQHALEAITPAEERLQQLADPRTPRLENDRQSLANSLQGSSSAPNAAGAIASSPKEGAAALRGLAGQLPSMSPAEQKEVANRLQQAANNSQDPSMRQSLQQASTDLKKGDTQSAAGDLEQAAQQLDSLQQQEDNASEVNQARNALESARQQLAQQADRDAGRVPQPQANNGQPAGGTSGSSQGQPGQTGSGSGAQQASSGQAGQTGRQGSGSGGGNAAAPTERIFVPGQPAPGEQANQPEPLGPGQEVPLRPYTEVVNSYQQAALDVVENASIPASQKDLVRDYFSSIAGSENAS